MRIFTILIFILLTHSYAKCHSQETNNSTANMTKKVQEIIDLGEDAIIALALKSIAENVTIKNFTTSKVLTNGKEVHVSFRNQFKYLPLNSIYYFDANVNLTSKTVYKNSIANPIGFSKEGDIPFYKQTKAIKKNIAFVKQAINNDNNFDGFEDEILIREHKNFYAIEVVSEAQESSYKIKKGTGEIYDATHAHLVPPPFESEESDKFQEVDFSTIKK